MLHMLHDNIPVVPKFPTPDAPRYARLPAQQRLRPGEVDCVGDVEQPEGYNGPNGHHGLQLADRLR